MKIVAESPGHQLGSLVPAVPSAPPSADGGVSFATALERVGGAVDRGELLVHRASRGDLGGLGPAELIALQAGIYRYSEAVELVAKLTDRVASAVRTVVSAHG